MILLRSLVNLIGLAVSAVLLFFVSNISFASPEQFDIYMRNVARYVFNRMLVDVVFVILILVLLFCCLRIRNLILKRKDMNVYIIKVLAVDFLILLVVSLCFVLSGDVGKHALGVN